MKPEDVAVIETLLRRIVDALHAGARDGELALDLLAAARHQGRGPRVPPGRFAGLVDDGRFAVRWNGRECMLGQTVRFRLFRRLALAAGNFVTNEQLFEAGWSGERTSTALRSAITALRRSLGKSGMADLARAIDGKQSGHYALRLDLLPPSGGSHSDATATPP